MEKYELPLVFFTVLSQMSVCNAANNFGLMCNQFWIAILSV